MFVFKGLDSGDGQKEFLVRVFIARRWRATDEEKPNSERAMRFRIAFYVLFVSVLCVPAKNRSSAARGLLRKLHESLLCERERIRLHPHRSLKRLINFRDGNQNERQQQREDEYVDEMQCEILAAEKACRPYHHDAANHQNTPENPRKFHPAFNLAEPPVL